MDAARLGSCSRFNGAAAAAPGQPKESDEKPIRLIDVLSTINGSSKGSICFTAGAEQGWDFHVISHTWSLDVRNLSEAIGKRVGSKKAQSGGADAYNDAFKDSDFSKECCYKMFIEFLQILVPEGVKQIWFDALCINQVDHEEKAKEIGNMGAYYSRSRGCYVILHGLGHPRGYQLWGENEALPRWFTRVWTFQEFMLPRRLIFIVEGLDRRLLEYVHREITAKSKNGLCRCFLQQMSEGEEPLWGSASNVFWWQFVEYSKGEEGSSSAAGRGMMDEAWEIPISSEIDETCGECKSVAMIRRAQCKTKNNAALYLVEREAYLGVMQYVPGRRMQRSERAGAGVASLCSLYTMLSQMRVKRIWNLRYTIAEVRERECSVEEDRVLAILALLGVQLSQLRTGKGLHTQLVELAKSSDEEMLAELCMMDAKPNCTLGMSWAPDFGHVFGHAVESASKQNPWHASNMRTRRCEVDVELHKRHVSDIGSIELFAKIVSGMVLPITALPIALIKEETLFHNCYIDGGQPPTHFIVVPILRCSTNGTDPNFEQLATPLIPSMESCSFLPLDLHETKTSGSTDLLLNFQLNWRATENSHVGHFQVPITITDNILDLKQLDVSFQVKMVILGSGEESGRGHLLSKVIMVCLSNTHEYGEKEELHKIGMLSLAEQTEQCEWDIKIKTFTKATRRRCLIGGFGSNLSSHVTLKWGKKVN